MLKAKVRSVDMYGFNGRDHHPTEADVGMTVSILTIETYCGEDVLTPGTLDAIQLEGLAQLDNDEEDEPIYQVLTCIRPNGTLVELIDFEVEVLS